MNALWIMHSGHEKNCDTVTGGSVLASGAPPPASVTNCFPVVFCAKLYFYSRTDRPSQVWSSTLPKHRKMVKFERTCYSLNKKVQHTNFRVFLLSEHNSFFIFLTFLIFLTILIFLIFLIFFTFFSVLTLSSLLFYLLF